MKISKRPIDDDSDDDWKAQRQLQDVKTYAAYFDEDTVGPVPQPGILRAPFSNMTFIVIMLKDGLTPEQHDEVKNALVAVENIQNPPYTDSNQTRYPTSSPSTKGTLPSSVYTFANRTSNLLPTNCMHFSIGFSQNLWVNKWKMGSTPKGLLAFTDWDNKYDDQRKPFQDLPPSDPLRKKYYDGTQYSIPAEKERSDICIQLKSSSRSLIDRVCAHALLLLHPYCELFAVGHGTVKQRNPLGFYDAASLAQFTASPTLDCGPVVRAWNSECADARAQRAKYGDQYVDLGRIPTIFIGDEEEEVDPQSVNGTFGVLCHFVFDMNGWNNLTVVDQGKVFGRTKEDSTFFVSADDPLKGTLNQQLPHSHIVRTHIRGQKVLKSERGTCPFQWLRPSEHQNNRFDDDGKQQTVEASSVPMQMYRQSAGYQYADGEQGLMFFGYARDCHLMNTMFERMIGQQSTFPHWPEMEQKLDPVIGTDPETKQKYYRVDQLLWFAKATQCEYYYFPNLQELLSLSKWPNTAMPTPTKLSFPVAGYVEDGSSTMSDGIRRFTNILSEQMLERKEDDDAASDIGGYPYPTTIRDGVMQGDPLREWMLALVKTNIGVVWKQRTAKAPKSMEGVNVVIVGAGMSGLCAGLELRKLGVNVTILEASDTVGGRVKTLRFPDGNHAEGGAMRLPGSPNPKERTVSHWLTDFYVDYFDLEVAPFKNDDGNALQKVYTERVFTESEIAGKFAEWAAKDFAGWRAQIEKGITHLKNESSGSHEAKQLQLAILKAIKNPLDYLSKAEDVVKQALTLPLRKIAEEYKKMPKTAPNYEKYIKMTERVWDEWVRMWSKYSVAGFLQREATKEELDFLTKVGLPTAEFSFTGLRPWPHVAVRAFEAFAYTPSLEAVSLPEFLRDSLGDWWEDPMHTLRDGMDVLPRSFVDPNLWGPQCQSNEQMTLAEQVVYCNEVFKVDYSAAAQGGKITVHARHTITQRKLDYECDYCIVSVPLPIVEYFEFEPALSLIKQEAIRSTQYMSSTKVCLEFRERFWAVDVEKGEEFHRPALPDGVRIDGGHSLTSAISSQIVYPTPTDYVPKGDQPFVEWDFSDTQHFDDDSKSGILVSYTWNKQAERLAAFDENTAMRTVLRDIADLHSAARYPNDDINRKQYRKQIMELFSAGKIQAWSRDPLTAGAFVLWGPFQEVDYLRNLRSWPEGIIKFADCKNSKDLLEAAKLAFTASDRDQIKECIMALSSKLEAELNVKGVDDTKDDEVEVEVEVEAAQARLDGMKRKLSMLQDKKIYFCGEAISWCNGWIQGALESALLTSYQLFDNYQTQQNEDYFPLESRK